MLIHKANIQSSFFIFQEKSIFDTNMTEIMNSVIDCGVDMNNETAASDYFNKIETCSFWMEGVLLTATGMYVACM